MTAIQKSAKKNIFPRAWLFSTVGEAIVGRRWSRRGTGPWGSSFETDDQTKTFYIYMSHFPLGLLHISQQNTVTNEVCNLIHIQFFNQKENKIYSFKLLP